MAANHVAVFLNFFFRQQADFASDGLDQAARDELLAELRSAWNEDAPGADLGIIDPAAPRDEGSEGVLAERAPGRP